VDHETLVLVSFTLGVLGSNLGELSLQQNIISQENKKEEIDGNFLVLLRGGIVILARVKTVAAGEGIEVLVVVLIAGHVDGRSRLEATIKNKK